MTLAELKEKLKKNLPEEFQDDVDDFAAYLMAAGQDELFALIDLAIDRQFGTLRRKIIKTLSTPEILEDMATRNDAWAVRLQLRAQKKKEFQDWIKKLLKALLLAGLDNLLKSLPSETDTV